MKTSEAFWDGVATKYAAQPIADEKAYAWSLERTASYLGAGSQVLEVGCGTGTTALRLAGAAGHITATDLSGRLIDVARARAAEQGIANVDFRHAPLEADQGGPFDAVLAFNLLHLIDDLPAALSALRAMVRPGGVLVSKTACLGERPGVLPLVIRVMQWLGKAPSVQFLKIDELERAIEAAGFALVETSTHNVKPAVRYLVARRV